MIRKSDRAQTVESLPLQIADTGTALSGKSRTPHEALQAAAEAARCRGGRARVCHAGAGPAGRGFLRGRGRHRDGYQSGATQAHALGGCRVFELVGVDVLPIVSLISLLVGFIIAFESARPFTMFGARISIANMIGILISRELGLLMTAIILAGGSGSAFAEQRDTVKQKPEEAGANGRD